MVLTYHNIGQQKGFNTVSYAAFQAQLYYLIRHYEVISVDQYVNHILQYGKSAERTVVLTFDDGYASFAALVMPLLKKHNIPAALFVCNRYIGKRNEWDKPFERIPIMNEATLKTLASDPLITIGSHTMTHSSLTSLHEWQLAAELTTSKVDLEQLLETSVKYLAYPYGQKHLNINSQVIHAAREAGYMAAFSTNFKNRNKKECLFVLNRLDITCNDSLRTFQHKLQPYSFYSFKQEIKNIYSHLKQSLSNS